MEFLQSKSHLYRVLFWATISSLVPVVSGISLYSLQESGYLDASVYITVSGYRDWGTEELYLLVDGEIVDSHFVGLTSIGWWTLHDSHTLSVAFSFGDVKAKQKEPHTFQVIGQNGEETNTITKTCRFGSINQIQLSMERPLTGHLRLILNTTASYPHGNYIFTLYINDYPVYSEEKMYYTHLTASINYGSWELLPDKNYTIRLVTNPPTDAITQNVNIGPGEWLSITLIL